MHAYPLINGHLYLVTCNGRTQTVIAPNGAAAIQIAAPIFLNLE